LTISSESATRHLGAAYGGEVILDVADDPSEVEGADLAVGDVDLGEAAGSL
jgi:hypothetical protein